MKIYWYAPFDNADELDVAGGVCRRGDDLTVESLATRFGKDLPTPSADFSLVRDLREPAGESGRRATMLNRSQVAWQRAIARERLLRSGSFDLIHIHTYNMFTDWLAFPALRRFGVPIVASIHNVLPHERRGPDHLERAMHRFGYRACDRILVAHEALKHQLVDEFGIIAATVGVIPLPVPRVETTNTPDIADAKLMLFFGTLRHNKGIPVLLEAIERIPADEDIRFHFAGRGAPDLERLVTEAAERDPRITAEVGWISPERQAELMSEAWAVLLPYTDFSAQSGVLRNAYSYHVPAIASAIGALGAAVEEDGSGWLVQPGAPAMLADTIVASANDPARRLEMSRVTEAIAADRRPSRIGSQIRDQYDLVARGS